MQEVLAIIPARGGSKGVPNKNIMSLHGKPLIAYSIEQAIMSKKISKVLVSTDNPLYAEIASSFGAEVPFLRPSDISGDLSTDIEAFKHALNFLERKENYKPSICVHLRPTYPNRKIEDIDKMIQLLLDNPVLDSVRSVTIAKETPYKMWFLNEEDSLLKPVMEDTNIKEAYNEPRQILPKVYIQNGCIDVMRRETIVNLNSMTGNSIGAYKMENYLDIDTYEDFENTVTNFIDFENKVFCFDIDGVIAYLSPENDYNRAKPNFEIIRRINKLYSLGCKIILFTARGSMTGIDWFDTTKKQMERWGVKHHELKLGKPAADFYIDDRNVSLVEFLSKKII